MKLNFASALIAILVLAAASISCGAHGKLMSVAITPSPANINFPSPGTLQLQAVGTFSDGTTMVLPSATWTFSAVSQFFTVDSKGLASCTGVQGGPVFAGGDVTATFEGVSGSERVFCNSPGA